jgi:3-oxoacyl-[acyl-carrier protein] reductase
VEPGLRSTLFCRAGAAEHWSCARRTRRNDNMDLRLKGRVALVTGASKGIGKAIARGLAEEGVNLVVLARGKEALEHTAEQIRKEQGVRVLAVPADVRDIAQVKAAADAAKAELGTVHIVVNNAGSGIRRQDRQITWPDSDWVDDLNLKLIGALRVTQSFMPIMPRDWTGRIINISGIAGISAFIGALTHGLNNSAMNHMTSYLARDLAAEKITVNTVVPGLIATEWRHGWAENMGRQQGKSKDQFVEDICRAWGIVQGRWGTMEELADLVTFLASDRAVYVNGARIAFDGGYSINPR